MAAVAPAHLPQRGDRRPSYQYYNNQESTLLPEVPLLTGTDNFRLWEVAVLAHLRHYNLDDTNNSEARDRSTPSRRTRDGTLCLSWDEMQNRIKVYQIIRRSIADALAFLEKECRSNPWISLNDPTYDAKGLYELVKAVFTARPPPLDSHQSQDDMMIDLLMLKAVNFGSLSEYLDRFYALWSRIDMAGLQLTDDLLLSFLLSGLNGHYDRGWTENLDVQRLMKKIDLHEALKLIGERVCEENMVVLPPVPPKDEKYTRRSSRGTQSSSSTEHGVNMDKSAMDESVRGCFGHEGEVEDYIMRRQEEMATHFEGRTLQWAVESAFATSWSLDDLDPVSSEYDTTTTENGRSDDGRSRSASPVDKKERRRGYKRLSDLMARYTPLPLSVASSPSTIAATMDALRIDDKSEHDDTKPRNVPSPSPTDESAARKERRRYLLSRFTGTPTKSLPVPNRVMSYQEGWKPKPLFSSPRKFSWEDGASNSEHDYQSMMLRTTPEPHQVRRVLPATPGTGSSEKQQGERDEYRPSPPRKRISAFSPEKVVQKTAIAIRNFSRPERPLIRTASL